MTPPDGPPGPKWTRRRLLGGAAAASAAILVGGLELVARGDLPGRYALADLDGACDVTTPEETFTAPGPTVTGTFFSQARRREVGWAIAYPPAHRPGDRLPLALYLHADGGDHASPLGRLTPAKALAGSGVAPFAIASFDGGDLYWNPHPGDDPMAMIVDEIIPLCRRRGLGDRPGAIAAIGISMGGYGAILLAERHPTLIAAVAAISPAIWTSYSEAERVNPSAFDSARDFAADDVITHADALAQIPIRIASGSNDPFHPGVVAFVHRLGPDATVDLTAGCHDTSFFAAQQRESLRFLGEHLIADVDRGVSEVAT